MPEGYPAWSPDGRHIAFLRWNPAGADVYVIPALGGPERKLTQSAAVAPNSGTPTPGSGSEYGVGWTADGKYLAIADRSSPQEPNAIFLLSTETYEKRRLTFPPAGYGGDMDPAVSPDGTRLAFIRFRTGESSDLYVLPLAAGKPAGDPGQLTSDGRRIFGLSWTADGRAIVFSSNREGARGLWKITLSGGSPEPLAFAGEGGSHPSISVRGRRLAYVQIDRLDSDLVLVENFR